MVGPNVQAEVVPTLKLSKLQYELLQDTGAANLACPPNEKLKPNGDMVWELPLPAIEELSAALAAIATWGDYNDRQRIQAITKKVNALAAKHRNTEATFKWNPKRRGSRCLQFRIVLLGLLPVVWRRIIVPEGNLLNLHRWIQGAMGWRDCHLHQFNIGYHQFSNVPDDNLLLHPFMESPRGEADVYFSSMVSTSPDAAPWEYWYDFGDDWKHEIRFEGYIASEKGRKYPICIDGMGACPPEDSGGVWGFGEYLEAISDPEHPDHEHLLEWYGPFDRHAFLTDDATKRMQA